MQQRVQTNERGTSLLRTAYKQERMRASPALLTSSQAVLAGEASGEIVPAGGMPAARAERQHWCTSRLQVVGKQHRCQASRGDRWGFRFLLQVQAAVHLAATADGSRRSPGQHPRLLPQHAFPTCAATFDIAALLCASLGGPSGVLRSPKPTHRFRFAGSPKDQFGTERGCGGDAKRCNSLQSTRSKASMRMAAHNCVTVPHTISPSERLQKPFAGSFAGMSVVTKYGLQCKFASAVYIRIASHSHLGRRRTAQHPLQPAHRLWQRLWRHPGKAEAEEAGLRRVAVLAGGKHDLGVVADALPEGQLSLPGGLRQPPPAAGEKQQSKFPLGANHPQQLLDQRRRQMDKKIRMLSKEVQGRRAPR